MNQSFKQSDKYFWHQYIDFYDHHLESIKVTNIIEIGVFNGDSIRYWRDKYPSSSIIGIDILEEKESWPKDDKIEYVKMDQSDSKSYTDLLKSKKNKFDLIIEDGSHDPLHQKISLIESLDYLNDDAVYILEDIHTSHENHYLYKNRLKNFRNKNLFKKKNEKILMPLQALLLIKHLKENNLDTTVFSKYDETNSLFNCQELEKLFNRIKKIEIYKRSNLPNYCYNCNSTNYDYINLKCNCGVDLYEDCDSMSALIKF